MLITLSASSGPFPPHWLSPESISSATRHPGACSGAIMCKTVERGGRDRTCLCIYGKRREPAQMIPSMKYRERLHEPSGLTTPRIERVFKNRELPNSKYPQRRTRSKRTKISSQIFQPQRKHILQHFGRVATCRFEGSLQTDPSFLHVRWRTRGALTPSNSAFRAQILRMPSLNCLHTTTRPTTPPTPQSIAAQISSPLVRGLGHANGSQPETRVRRNAGPIR